MVGGCSALADHSQNADPSGDWRDCCGRHNLTAGTARGSAQLGLSVLLAAGCDADPICLSELGLLRGGGSLARLAAARCRRGTAADADYVRHCRGAPAARIRGALA